MENMFDRKIEITETTLNKLGSFPEGTSGFLMTTDPDQNVITIVGCCIDDNMYDMTTYKNYLPGGIELGGKFLVSLETCRFTDGIPLAVTVHPTTSQLQIQFNCNAIVSKELPISVISEAELAANYFIIRVRSSIPVTCEANEDSIKAMAKELRLMVGDAAIFELENLPRTKTIPSKNTKQKYTSLKNIEVMNMTLLQNMNCSGLAQAVVINYQKKNTKIFSFDVDVDSIAMSRRTDDLECLIKNIKDGLEKNIRLYEKCLLDQIEKTRNFDVAKVFHFLLEDYFLSVVYPKKELDRELEQTRGQLHSIFSLPKNRPLLMKGNSLSFSVETVGKELINVHESVGPSNVAGGEPVLVQGRYAYYHYCQQGADDNGWGCAYRSLQTLCSWFKLEGYTNKSVPTLTEIQQCLVNIGDKPSSFVGSSQWIGSTEVGFCLDTLLGVSSRFTNVSSGDELSMKGGELSHHFKTQGTPIMIGGGNLAHTILGVDYNKKTGDIKFLILDPHYTGAEDLNTILAKGWCGWKGIDFWKKGSFYNMCMPIRPKCF